MSYALVAHTFQPSTNNNTITTGTALNTTGASLLVVGVSYFSGTTNVISDSKGNTWTDDAVFATNAGGAECRISYCRNPTSVGTGHTFTDTTTGGFPCLYVAAFSGGNTTVNRDQADTNKPVAPPALASDTGITPSEANELVLSMLAITQSGHTYTIGSGFTVLDQAPGDGAHYFSGALAYAIQGAAAPAVPVNPIWTESGVYDIPTTGLWSFKAAGGGAAALAVPSTGLVDTTTRADENPLSNGGYWGTVGNAQLVSNRIAAVTNTTFNAYSGPTYAADSEVYMTVSTLPVVGNHLYLFLRLATNYYYCQLVNYLGGNSFQEGRLYRGPSGSETLLLTTPAPVTLAAGGQFGFRAIGSTLTAYVNGTAFLTMTDPSPVLTGGSIGIMAHDTTVRLSAIGGGTVGGFPTTGIIDNTTRANEPVLSNGGVWSGVVNTQLLSNQIKAVTNTTFYALTAAQTSSPDCEMYSTLAAHPAVGNLWQLYVRHNPVGLNNYTLNLVNYAGSNTYTTVTLAKTVAGTTTTLGTLGSTVIAPGAQLGLQITGTVLTGFLNGAPFITATDGANSVPAAGQLVFLGQDSTIAFTQVGAGPMGGPPADTGLRSRAMHHYATQRS